MYPKAMLNIHPALLPAFGGKGFYGMKVHEAVLASGAKYSGIPAADLHPCRQPNQSSGATVHYVNEDYDRGVILDQRVVPVLQNDSAASLAQRVLRQVRLARTELERGVIDCVSITGTRSVLQLYQCRV